MKRYAFLLIAVIATCVSLAVPGRAPAEEIDELKQQLEAAKQLIRSLEQRIERLEQQSAAVPPGTAPATPAEDSKAVEPDGSFSIYGFVQTDLIQDFNRVDPDWNSSLRPSKIPTQEGIYGDDGETIFSVKQTRLGFLSDYPTTYGDFKTKLEIDFYGVGSDAGETAVRPRHFFGELGPILAGQTHSLFMDINVFPNTIDYWGPSGMVFLRNPQVRWTPVRGATTFAVALEKPGNDVSWGVDSAADAAGSLQSQNDLPDLSARAKHSGEWGYVQLGGILRKVGFETVGGATQISDDALGWGFNLSTNINTFERDRLILSAVYGEAVANYMNDGGNDVVVVDGKAETLPLLGAVAYYDHYWNDSLSSSIGYSFTSIDNNDAQTDDSFKLGQYASANLLWSPTEKTLFGVEYLYGKREDKDGETGDDHRVQFTFKYSFDQRFPIPF